MNPMALPKSHHIRNKSCIKASFIQWNPQSIKNKKANLRKLLDEDDNNVDVILVSETWLKPEDNFAIPGYKVHRLDRINDKGGGIAIFISNKHSFQVLNIKTDFNPNVEMCAIHIPSFNLDLVSLYKPPNIKVKERDWIGLLGQFKGNVLITGDFNAHHSAWGCRSTNAQGRELASALDSLNLVFLNDGTHTRISTPQKNSSAIDLTLVSPNLVSKSSWRVLEDTLGSDHFPIKIEMDINYIPSMIYPTTKWKESKADWDIFRNILANVDFSIFHSLETDEKYKFLTCSIENACNISMPHKKPFLPKHRVPIWWDGECDEIVRRRKAALVAYKQVSNYKNYNSYRNVDAQSKRLFRGKSRESWRTYVSKLNKGTPISKIWDMIKKISNKNRNTRDKTSLCEELIENILSHLAPATVQAALDLDNSLSNRNTLLDAPFTMNELLKVVKTTATTAPGKDNITYSIIKHLPEKLLTYFLEIMNDWWIEGKFSDILKEIIICLILKPGKNSQLAESYRPISLISCVAKTFERMIKLRLEWYLESNSLLPRYQFGFRRGLGTSDAIASLVCNIQLGLTEKKYVALLFADIRGAYDAVDLNLLGKKLLDINLSKKSANNILQLFLNRKIYVRDDYNRLHGPRIVSQGLMQGSVLSPLLFNVYTAGLHKLNGDYSCIQYADDVCLIAVKDTLQSCANALEGIVADLKQWMSDHGFNMAPEKCAIMICSSKRQNLQGQSIRLCDMTFPVVKQYKYLGVILDHKLLWTEHIKYVESRCEKACNILRCTTKRSWGADPRITSLFYKSYIRSIVDYGCTLYGSAARSNLISLDRIQYKCLRLVLGAMRSTPCPTLLSETREFSLELRRSHLAIKYIIKLSFCDVSNLLPNICHLTTLCLTHKYWNKKKEPLLCQAFIRFNEFPYVIRTQGMLPVFARSLEISTYLPKIIYQSYTISREYNNMLLNNCLKGLPDYIAIYTDGSKSGAGVGCGFYCPSSSYRGKFKLPSCTSVYCAEAFAILKALDWAYRSNIRCAAIITDSRSVLEALQNISSGKLKNGLLLDILQLCCMFMVVRREVMFIWAKGHAGISGNEIVDKLAKDACSDGEECEYILEEDVVRYYLKQIETLRSNEWSVYISQTKNQYARLHPFLPKSALYESEYQFSRAAWSTIFRLKVEHGRFPSHLYKIGVLETPACNCDHLSICDLNHIIFSCPLNTLATLKLMKELLRNNVHFPTNLCNVLSTENVLVYKSVLQFFKEINMVI